MISDEWCEEVGCKVESHQISDGGTSGPHSAESSMARGVQEGEGLLTVRHLHLKSTNVLHKRNAVDDT